jgi:hypothetical protein
LNITVLLNIAVLKAIDWLFLFKKNSPHESRWTQLLMLIPLIDRSRFSPSKMSRMASDDAYQGAGGVGAGAVGASCAPPV